jgi:hypothetical protein
LLPACATYILDRLRHQLLQRVIRGILRCLELFRSGLVVGVAHFVNLDGNVLLKLLMLVSV